MNFKFTIFFFFVIILKTIISVQSAGPAFEHDVTKLLDSWIAKVLKINLEMIKKPFTKITQKKLETFRYDIGRDTAPLGKEFLFHDVYMNISDFKSPQLNWKFSENKMGVFVKEYTVRIMGDIRQLSDVLFVKFDTFLELENVTFTLSIDKDENPSIEFKFDHSLVWYNEELGVNIYFHNGEDLSDNNRKELEKALFPVLPVLLRENFKLNDEFAKSLRTIFNYYTTPKNTLLKSHADFFADQNKYYYLIPQISYFCFHLKKVIIKGLSNLEWFKINSGLSVFTHTLMIRNVQGTLELDYGSEQENPIELQFKIDYFSVSCDRKSVNVDARCYSVNKTDNTPLPYRQSALIMQRIESAVANSLFPSLAVLRTYDIDTPLEQIKITDKTDWNKIKSQFHEWIPFSDGGSTDPSPPPPQNLDDIQAHNQP